MATEAVKIIYVEGSAPSTPSGSRVVMYAKSDGLMYSKDDAGVETLMSSGSSGAVATDALWDAKGDLAGGTGANTASKLTVGTNGMVLVAASGETTGMKWAWPPGHEFDYVQGTSNVTVSGTAETSAGSTLVLTGNSFTADGEAVILEYFCPAAASGDTAGHDIRVAVFESTTFLGRLSIVQAAATSGSADVRSLHGFYRFTPSAGSHTYLIRASRTSSDGTLFAGAGGATNYVPMFMRITKA